MADPKPDKSKIPPDLIVAPYDPTVAFALPEQFYTNDAGVDLFVAEHQLVQRGTKALVRTNVAVKMREGAMGLIVGRGSAYHSRGIHVIPGVLDPGYRGEIKVMVFSAGPKGVQLQRGERIAQLVLLPYLPIQRIAKAKDRTVLLEMAEDGERGDRAFGSTDQLVTPTEESD